MKGFKDLLKRPDLFSLLKHDKAGTQDNDNNID